MKEGTGRLQGNDRHEAMMEWKEMSSFGYG